MIPISPPVQVGDERKLHDSNSADIAHQSIVDQKSTHRSISLHAIWRACGPPGSRPTSGSSSPGR